MLPETTTPRTPADGPSLLSSRDSKGRPDFSSTLPFNPSTGEVDGVGRNDVAWTSTLLASNRLERKKCKIAPLARAAGRALRPATASPCHERVSEVDEPDFDPVRDFGGWRIKRGLMGDFAGVWAFNLAGTGVLVRTRQGKRYLIGTDHPERLAATLNAARDAA